MNEFVVVSVTDSGTYCDGGRRGAGADILHYVMTDYFHAMYYHMLAKVFRKRCMNGIVRGYSFVRCGGRG